MIMLHIKLKGIANAATCWQIFCLQPPLPSEGQNSTFSEHGHAAHLRNCECSNMAATADRGTINMKHINRDFGSKTCAGPPGWT